MKHVLIAIIRFYQLAISPMLGSNCRFYPTCSHYAKEAIAVHGALKGSWLAIRRIGRCNPWYEGGVDLVPKSHKVNCRCATHDDKS
ncbi:membrane protein insertion efficiency factor YidD [Candidatus Thiothrix anitrata]|uniref:Putative membrane protein insertion efficiency factor n=1 Tax=Candidatus Thiothrix anitrata TaxID=2823902 RepID=A0ABX7X4G3_9GAMM|nr:membrane protein insertion efficiency factor YidD [Candidatus Thiothrix anitrata]QTR50769.1 membrane protein insertion efficiency factor YidD [Candidatus Thiothrix anitrata]